MLGSIGVAVVVPKIRQSGWVEFVHPMPPTNGWILKAMKAATPFNPGLMPWKLSLSVRLLQTALYRGQSPIGIRAGDVLPAREAVRAGMADLVGGMKDASRLSPHRNPNQKESL